MDGLKKFIRSVPNFPKQGINYYDITTLIEDPTGFSIALSQMQKFVSGCQADKLIAIEARGFIFGAALADRLKLPLYPARKSGKLPYRKISQSYQLEYGTDTIELHSDAAQKGDRVVIVDDLIATGGTIKAVCALVEQLGAEVAGISTVIDLSFLPWREVLQGYRVDYLISYDSE